MEDTLEFAQGEQAKMELMGLSGDTIVVTGFVNYAPDGGRSLIVDSSVDVNAFLIRNSNYTILSVKKIQREDPKIESVFFD